ncbi:MAG: fimbrillin family protein [Bacteroides sp.]|nr:fimbrillin family protein [Bacteroides sp.]MCM1379449.1 fimbrillin family protein [Bacteroides sp.]MCM1445310.1 fimbrillin family protein [Prevotella sp.]
MNKKLFIGIAAAALLTACSNDEVITDYAQDNNQIRVGGVANLASRAANSYCNEVMPENLILAAAHTVGNGVNEGVYFMNAEMTTDFSKASNTHTIYDFVDSNYYWPDNTLDFFGWSCTQEGPIFDLNLNADETAYVATISGFEVAAKVADQADLIYAVKHAGAKAEEPVDLEFKHALSQVVFNAKVENKNINVVISEVGLRGLYNAGTFTWYDLGETPAKDALYGEWTLNEGAAADNTYMVTLDQAAEVSTETDKVALTAAPDDHTVKAGWANVMQLLPQYYGEKVQHEFNVPRLTNQVYIKVRCNITAQNAKADEGHETVTLYADTKDGEAQFLYVPVPVDWQPGKRYVYTIIFTEKGNGGITDPENPDDVLHTIHITATCEEYVEQPEIEVKDAVNE